MKWNMARMGFTVNTFSWTEYDTADIGTYTVNYTVNPEGKIVFDYGDGNQHVISFNEMTNDYIEVCQDGDCNIYLFFDETKAKAFRDSQKGGIPTPTTFTQEIVSENSWYRVEYGLENGANVAYCNGIFAYDGNNNLTASWTENENTESVTGSYAITDDKVVVPHDGKTETETLLTFENSVITTDSVTVEGDSTYSGNVKWFQNQVDAEAFLATYGEQSCF